VNDASQLKQTVDNVGDSGTLRVYHQEMSLVGKREAERDAGFQMHRFMNRTQYRLPYSAIWSASNNPSMPQCRRVHPDCLKFGG
jgi:hypothetical protein